MVGEKIDNFYLHNLSNSKKRLLKNFSSLTILQIFQYLIPLVTFPYLLKVLGPEKYGLANFILAFLAYFLTLVDYGFNISAVREVSLARNNEKQLSIIFNSTFLIRIAITAILLLVYLCIICFVPKFYSNINLYLIVFIFLIGNGVSTFWFLQGLERMVSIAVIPIIFRTIATILIFVLVNNSNDVKSYLLIVSSANLLIGISIFLYSVILLKIEFFFPKKIQILFRLKRGWEIFVSNIYINLYTSSNTFFLGLFSGDVSVGIYSMANKTREAVQGLLSNIGKVIFPQIGYAIINDKNNSLIFIKKVISITSLLALIFGLIMFFFSKEIIYLLADKNYNDSIIVLQVLAFIPFLIVLSNFFGYQLMINLGFDKKFRQIIGVAALVNIIFLLVLIPLYNSIGAAISIFIAEFVTTFLTARFILNRKLLF